MFSFFFVLLIRCFIPFDLSIDRAIAVMSMGEWYLYGYGGMEKGDLERLIRRDAQRHNGDLSDPSENEDDGRRHFVARARPQRRHRAQSDDDAGSSNDGSSGASGASDWGGCGSSRSDDSGSGGEPANAASDAARRRGKPPLQSRRAQNARNDGGNGGCGRRAARGRSSGGVRVASRSLAVNVARDASALPLFGHGAALIGPPGVRANDSAACGDAILVFGGVDRSSGVVSGETFVLFAPRAGSSALPLCTRQPHGRRAPRARYGHALVAFPLASSASTAASDADVAATATTAVDADAAMAVLLFGGDGCETFRGFHSRQRANLPDAWVAVLASAEPGVVAAKAEAFTASAGQRAGASASVSSSVTWLPLDCIDAPPATCHAAAVFIAAQNEFLVFGGCADDGRASGALHWLRVAAEDRLLYGRPAEAFGYAPDARYGHSMVADTAANVCFVFGGFGSPDDLQPLPDVPAAAGFAPPLWNVGATAAAADGAGAPAPPAFAAAPVGAGRRMAEAGASAPRPLHDLFLLDLETLMWREVSLPYRFALPCRAFHSMVRTEQGTFLAVAGVAHGAPIRAWWEFEPTSQAWGRVEFPLLTGLQQQQQQQQRAQHRSAHEHGLGHADGAAARMLLPSRVSAASVSASLAATFPSSARRADFVGAAAGPSGGDSGTDDSGAAQRRHSPGVAGAVAATSEPPSPLAVAATLPAASSPSPSVASVATVAAAAIGAPPSPASDSAFGPRLAPTPNAQRFRRYGAAGAASAAACPNEGWAVHGALAQATATRFGAIVVTGGFVDYSQHPLLGDAGHGLSVTVVHTAHSLKRDAAMWLLRSGAADALLSSCSSV